MKMVLLNFLNKVPRLKAYLRSVRDWVCAPPDSVSSHYVQMGSEADSEAARLRSAWQSEELPPRQRELVDRQLAEYRNGKPVDVFDVMVRVLQPLCTEPKKLSVLEIGCSSGFYSEVMAISGLAVDYSGCDYSEAFIDLARISYPALRFDVEDATALSYTSNSFDVVISGCCLLHIPEYPVAIAEAARVATEYVVFHRTPVVINDGTKYFHKQAYGIETVEIHVNEDELLGLFLDNGLMLIDTITLDEELDESNPLRGKANRTYVCHKIKQ
jgi:2-polyprenyl-3-methyl-5-hydroxy-6-metoxy-1,4-benzoquinol methylase